MTSNMDAEIWMFVQGITPHFMTVSAKQYSTIKTLQPYHAAYGRIPTRKKKSSKLILREGRFCEKTRDSVCEGRKGTVALPSYCLFFNIIQKRRRRRRKAMQKIGSTEI